MKIGIIGLGFVGLSLALVLASKGNTVIGIDSDEKKIGKLKNGIVPFYEPKMEKILEKSLIKSLTVSSDISIAVKNCKFIFITVGTPISKDGFIDLTNISYRKNSKKYH